MTPSHKEEALQRLHALPYRPEYCLPERLAFHARLGVQSPSNNELRKMHFAPYKRLREDFALELRSALGRDAPPRLQRSALIYVRRCGNDGLDWDNAYGGLKPVQDCLTAPSKSSPSGLHIIEDDDPVHMPFPPFVFQGKASPGKGNIEVFVFDLLGVEVAERGNAWLG